MANRFVLNETSYHGKGAITAIPTEATARGYKKALVCSDPDLIKFGVTKKVTDLLDEAAMSENAKKARSYVKKALKLNPDHIGAQLFLIDLEDSQIDKIGKLLELQAREKQRDRSQDRRFCFF